MKNQEFSLNSYNYQLNTKIDNFKQKFKSIFDKNITILPSPHKNFRQRIEFRVWKNEGKNEYAMFNKGDNRQPYFINQMPIASIQINQLMIVIKSFWDTPLVSEKLFQIEFFSSQQNDVIVTFCYHKKIPQDWIDYMDKISKKYHVNIIGRSRKQKIVIGRDYIYERLLINNQSFLYQQPEGSFTQPNAFICEKMIEWTVNNIDKKNSDLLELYCGNGNFTLPLSHKFKNTLATEVNKSAIKHAKINCSINNIHNIQFTRLSSEEITLALSNQRTFKRLSHLNINTYSFHTVFVDPPRSGLDQNTCLFISQFETIIYISCNPETLLDNLKMLSATHRIEKIAIFDQFPYTPHLESGVILKRKE